MSLTQPMEVFMQTQTLQNWYASVLKSGNAKPIAPVTFSKAIPSGRIREKALLSESKNKSLDSLDGIIGAVFKD